MSQTLQAQFGMTTAGESMALPLEAHEQHFASHVFEGGKHLLPLLDIAAQITFAVNDEQWSVNVFYIGDRRHATVAFGIIPGRNLHVIDCKFAADIAAAEK